jgi:ABC-type branched-subunit amino acid transport system substrate-binding protein
LIGKTEEAYFRMINDKGGINGRKISFVSYDDDLSRANVMKQAANLKDFTPDTLLPGVKVNTASDFAPISQLQIQRFNGGNGSCSATSSAVTPPRNKTGFQLNSKPPRRRSRGLFAGASQAGRSLPAIPFPR